MYRRRGILVAFAACMLAVAVSVPGGIRLQDIGHLVEPLLAVHPGILCLIVGLNMLSLGLAGLLWTALLRCLGYQVPLRAGLVAYLGAGLSSYLLNGVGPALSCAVTLRSYGLAPRRAAVLSLLANALGFCGVLVWTPVGALVLGRAGVMDQLPLVHEHGLAAVALLLGALLLGMVLVLHTLAGAVGTRSALARRLLGDASRLDRAAVRTRRLLLLVPLAAAVWLIGALSLYATLGAVSPAALHQPVQVIGTAALAETLGSLAFFVPAGLGVRDGLQVTLLAGVAGIPVARTVGVLLALRLLDPLIKVGLLLALGASAYWRRTRSHVARARSETSIPYRTVAVAAAAGPAPQRTGSGAIPRLPAPTPP